MNNRLLTVAGAALAIAGIAGCSSPASGLGSTAAQVTINGNDAGGSRPIVCNQTGWSHIIETAGEAGKNSGFTAVIATGDEFTLESVEIRDLGGFTGSYWADKIGKATLTGENGAYTISGTAEGSLADGDEATANFEIRTKC